MRRALFDIDRQAAVRAAADRIVWRSCWAWCGVQLWRDGAQKCGCPAPGQADRSAVGQLFGPPEHCLLAFFSDWTLKSQHCVSKTVESGL